MIVVPYNGFTVTVSGFEGSLKVNGFVPVVQNRKIKAKRKRWLRSNEQIPYILLTLKLATY